MAMGVRYLGYSSEILVKSLEIKKNRATGGKILVASGARRSKNAFARRRRAGKNKEITDKN